MNPSRPSFTRKLLHPATLIAVLALFIATTGAAYAIVITGAQIKDGTVTGADIKNGSLGAVDLSSGAKGVRAVAAVWGDSSGCHFVSGSARGFAKCTRKGAGDYTLTVSNSVNMSGTYPACSYGANGGFNSLYSPFCGVGPGSSSRTVRIRVGHVDETTTGAPQPNDPTQYIPVVVMIP